MTKPPLHKAIARSITARIRTWFLTGIIVSAPITITIYIVLAIIDFVDRNVSYLLPEALSARLVLPYAIPGLGLIIAFVFLTILGYVTSNLIGRRLLHWGERFLDRVPVVRGLYNALKQLFETVLGSTGQSFRKVVLVEYPRKDMWTFAFVASAKTGEVGQKVGADFVALYVPTTPNPTSGYLVYASAKEIIPLDMSVEDAMKLIISGGVVQPPDVSAQALRK